MPTRKTRQLTPDEALEILASTIALCKGAGVQAKAHNIYDQGTEYVAIIIEGAKIVDGKIQLVSSDPIEPVDSVDDRV